MQSYHNNKYCSLCQISGKLSRLALYQINFKEAVYLCTQQKCNFPLLDDDLESFIVSRSVSQVDNLQSSFVPTCDSDTPSRDGMDIYEPQTTHVIDLFSLFNCGSNVNSAAEPNKLETKTNQPSESECVDKTVPYISTLSTNGNMFSDEEKANILSVSENCDYADSINKIDLPTNSTIYETNSPFLIDDDLFDVLSAKDKECNSYTGTTLAGNKSNNNSRISVSKLHSCVTETPQPRKVCTPANSEAKVSNKDILSETRGIITECSDHSHLSQLSNPQSQFSLLQWKNKDNLCWLDVLLHCIVNSIVVRTALNYNVGKLANTSSVFYELCKTFDTTQEKFQQLVGKKEESMCETAHIMNELENARKTIFKLLETSCFLKRGNHESALEMFPNVLKLDDALKHIFSVQVRWEFACSACNHKQMRRSNTTVISFSTTSIYFHPLNASFLRPCFKCSAEGQNMSMIMENIPPCLMMHFQHGLPHNHFQMLDFGIQGYLYTVSVVIQYITSPSNHFIAWIRDSISNKWLQCDDLKESECHWRIGPPKIPPDQIHMILWEKQGLTSAQFSGFNATSNQLKHLQILVNTAAIISDEEYERNCLQSANTIEHITVDEIGETPYHDKEVSTAENISIVSSSSSLPFTTEKQNSLLKTSNLCKEDQKDSISSLDFKLSDSLSNSEYISDCKLSITSSTEVLNFTTKDESTEHTIPASNCDLHSKSDEVVLSECKAPCAFSISSPKMCSSPSAQESSWLLSESKPTEKFSLKSEQISKINCHTSSSCSIYSKSSITTSACDSNDSIVDKSKNIKLLRRKRKKFRKTKKSSRVTHHYVASSSSTEDNNSDDESNKQPTDLRKVSSVKTRLKTLDNEPSIHHSSEIDFTSTCTFLSESDCKINENSFKNVQVNMLNKAVQPHVKEKRSDESRILKTKCQQAALSPATSSIGSDNLSNNCNLSNYFQIPSSLLKSILCPVVLLEDCMKKKSHSLVNYIHDSDQPRKDGRRSKFIRHKDSSYISSLDVVRETEKTILGKNNSNFIRKENKSTRVNDAFYDSDTSSMISASGGSEQNFVAQNYSRTFSSVTLHHHSPARVLESSFDNTQLHEKLRVKSQCQNNLVSDVDCSDSFDLNLDRNVSKTSPFKISKIFFKRMKSNCKKRNAIVMENNHCSNTLKKNMTQDFASDGSTDCTHCNTSCNISNFSKSSESVLLTTELHCKLPSTESEPKSKRRKILSLHHSESDALSSCDNVNQVLSSAEKSFNCTINSEVQHQMSDDDTNFQEPKEVSRSINDDVDIESAHSCGSDYNVDSRYVDFKLKPVSVILSNIFKERKNCQPTLASLELFKILHSSKTMQNILNSDDDSSSDALLSPSICRTKSDCSSVASITNLSEVDNLSTDSNSESGNDSNVFSSLNDSDSDCRNNEENLTDEYFCTLLKNCMKNMTTKEPSINIAESDNLYQMEHQKRKTNQQKTIALKSVNNGIILDSYCDILSSRHFQFQVPMKPSVVIKPTHQSENNEADDVTSKQVETKLSSKHIFPAAATETTNECKDGDSSNHSLSESEESGESEIEEWLPYSLRKRKRKEHSMKRRIMYSRYPIKFSSLPKKRARLSKNIVCQNVSFESYVSGNGSTAVELCNSTENGQSLLDTSLNLNIASKEENIAMHSEKAVVNHTLTSSVNKEADSGCGDCSSTSSGGSALLCNKSQAFPIFDNCTTTTVSANTTLCNTSNSDSIPVSCMTTVSTEPSDLKLPPSHSLSIPREQVFNSDGLCDDLFLDLGFSPTKQHSPNKEDLNNSFDLFSLFDL